jgi:Kef-type K+ transport system membrane component KefB
MAEPSATPRITTVLMVGTAVVLGGFALVRRLGHDLGPTLTLAPVRVLDEPHRTSTLAQVLFAIAVIVVVARVVGALGQRLRQPAVMGEILAGLMLGPSVLGALAPTAQAALFPDAVLPSLSIVAKIGAVLFMFLVGLELDPKLFRGQGRVTLAIAQASIVVPFLLGSALALALFHRYAFAGESFTVFALFLGVSMSVTAFPVLARILAERKMSHAGPGMIALGCAAINDAVAWCLLALASGVATAHVERAGTTVLAVLAFVAVMFFVVRPLARWLAAREERSTAPVSPTVLALVFGMMLLSAVATESIGIHALFGAFLFGVVVPHDGRLAEHIRVRTEDVVVVLFLPVFFAFTGLRTQLGLVSNPDDWLALGAIIAVGTIGKMGGSALAARAVGMSWRDAGTVGVLMNTRGLMELIVLNVGLDLGVLSPTLFAMLVVMALVTTFATPPLLDLVRPREAQSQQPAVEPVTGATG